MPSFRLAYRISLMVIALMSGPFSILREVLQFIDSAKYPERPLFMACLWTAFMVAMFLLWLDENQAKRQAEKTLKDNRPKLCLRPNGVEGREAWTTHPHPVAFTIQHIGGRVPTAIRFASIPSNQGKFLLQLASVPCADPAPHQSGVGFEVIQVGAPELSPKDWEVTRTHQKELLMLFIEDNQDGLIELGYPLTVNFKDGDDSLTQNFHLRFDMRRYSFSEDTTP